MLGENILVKQPPSCTNFAVLGKVLDWGQVVQVTKVHGQCKPGVVATVGVSESGTALCLK